MKNKYNRILLKLSGEALMGNEHSGISSTAINQYCNEVAEIHNRGVQIGIVIGGGNYFRGKQAKNIGINKVTGDYMGMLATLMNALALRDVFMKIGIDVHILSALVIPQIADVFNKEKVELLLQNNSIVIFAAGTGNPYFTTDSAAALRAIEIGADILIKATNVDGIFDADPRNNPNAKMFSNLSFKECIEKKLQVMDTTAFVLCQENQMPIAVLNLQKKESLLNFINDEKIGTIVK